MLNLETTHSKLTAISINFEKSNPIDLHEFYRSIEGCLHNMIQNREFVLYVSGADKKNPIHDFGHAIRVTYGFPNYTYVNLSGADAIHELSDEPQFLSGDFYILVGTLSSNDIFEFHMHLHSRVQMDFAGKEFIFVENDGNTLCWVNPSGNRSFVDEICNNQ